MVKICAVIDCKNRSNKQKSKKFFRFPKGRSKGGWVSQQAEKRRNLWLTALSRDNLLLRKENNLFVCSDHFTLGRPSMNSTDVDYVPTLRMNNRTNHKEILNATEEVDREHFITEEDASNDQILNTATGVDPDNFIIEEDTPDDQIVNVTTAEIPEVFFTEENMSEDWKKMFLDHNYESGHLQKSTQTIDYFSLLKEETTALRNIVNSLWYQKATFFENDRKTKFCTGISTYKAMILIFDLIEPHIEITRQHALQDKFQHFLLTLVRLRLNLSFKFLAYIFSVSDQTISRIFEKTLNIMYIKLKNFVYWPERQDLKRNMPECFKNNFGDSVTVIIDCFEIFMQVPSNLDAQAATWSNYKHNNTVKVLIGITPHGIISYISEAYGGRISDKLITEDCGLLNHLLPGDLILADRGFLIEDLVGLRMAKVKTPAFLNGKKQIEPKDIEETRNVANVRIHVERVIGSLKQKYPIFHNTLPLTMIKKKKNGLCTLNKMLTVCAALVNLCPKII